MMEIEPSLEEKSLAQIKRFQERPPLFFNYIGNLAQRHAERAELVSEITKKMDQPGNVTLVEGLPLAGKTSLFRICDKEFGHEKVVLLSMGPYSTWSVIEKLSQEKLWSELASVTIVKFARNRETVETLIRGMEEALKKKEIADWFVGQCLPELAKEQKRNLVLWIDEIEAIDYPPEGGFGEKGADFLKELIERIKESRVVSLVLSGINKKDGRLETIAKECTRIDTSFLTSEQTKKLAVEGGLIYKPEALERLYFLTGGHPFLVQVVLEKIEDGAEEQLQKERELLTITKEKVETAADSMLSDDWQRKLIDYLRHGFTFGEREFLLKRTKNGGYQMNAPEERFVLTNIPQEIKNSLSEKGLLERKRKGKNLSFKIPLLLYYLQKIQTSEEPLGD